MSGLVDQILAGLVLAFGVLSAFLGLKIKTHKAEAEAEKAKREYAENEQARTKAQLDTVIDASNAAREAVVAGDQEIEHVKEDVSMGKLDAMDSDN